MVDVTKLTIDEEYIIITKTKYKNKISVKTYRGICYGTYSNTDCLFANVSRVNKPYDIQYAVKPVKIFTKYDQYIELNQMRTILDNAKTAKQNMETRALNMILKKLVNEHFEW
jgi:hypothetical protein